jgi:phage gpG-like protein
MQHIINLPFGARLILDVETEELDKKIRELMGRASDRKKLMKAVANAMRADIRSQFKVGGDPSWTPLSPVTIAQKERLIGILTPTTKKGKVMPRLLQNGGFSAETILIISGRLRDSWGTLNSPDHVEKIDDETGDIMMGTKLIYAAPHQFGHTFKNGVSIPKRPVHVTSTGAQAMATAYKNYLSNNVPNENEN